MTYVARYEREEVEGLLQAMFNGWIIDNEHRPDADMPRATPDHSKSNSIWAWKIDIERAYATLAGEQKALLQEHFGNGVSIPALAVVTNWTTGEVRGVIEGAVSDLLDYLNGV